MLITKELIMSIVFVLGIGKYSESKAPKLYQMITEDGKTHNVQVEKNQKNVCPLHCGADHYHRALLLDNDIDIFLEIYTLENFLDNDSYLNSYAIIDLEEVIVEKNRNPQELKKIDVQTYLP